MEDAEEEEEEEDEEERGSMVYHMFQGITCDRIWAWASACTA